MRIYVGLQTMPSIVGLVVCGKSADLVLSTSSAYGTVNSGL
jgi:hypothetical protein